MGGKSIAGRAAAEKQRARMLQGLGKLYFEERAAQERSPPTREEVVCPHCGFKARYSFIRCPNCDGVRGE